jgi:hypothetical protein
VCVSGHDRSHERLGTDDVHDRCQIIREDRESHHGGYFWKRSGEEVVAPNAGLHRAYHKGIATSTDFLEGECTAYDGDKLGTSRDGEGGRPSLYAGGCSARAVSSGAR